MCLVHVSSGWCVERAECRASLLPPTFLTYTRVNYIPLPRPSATPQRLYVGIYIQRLDSLQAMFSLYAFRSYPLW